jgi:hypothetical protein
MDRRSVLEVRGVAREPEPSRRRAVGTAASQEKYPTRAGFRAMAERTQIGCLRRRFIDVPTLLARQMFHVKRVGPKTAG